jgi:hypothetical protein
VKVRWLHFIGLRYNNFIKFYSKIKQNFCFIFISAKDKRTMSFCLPPPLIPPPKGEGKATSSECVINEENNQIFV